MQILCKLLEINFIWRSQKSIAQKEFVRIEDDFLIILGGHGHFVVLMHIERNIGQID